MPCLPALCQESYSRFEDAVPSLQVSPLNIAIGAVIGAGDMISYLMCKVFSHGRLSFPFISSASAFVSNIYWFYCGRMANHFALPTLLQSFPQTRSR